MKKWRSNITFASYFQYKLIIVTCLPKDNSKYVSFIPFNNSKHIKLKMHFFYTLSSIIFIINHFNIFFKRIAKFSNFFIKYLFGIKLSYSYVFSRIKHNNYKLKIKL